MRYTCTLRALSLAAVAGWGRLQHRKYAAVAELRRPGTGAQCAFWHGLQTSGCGPDWL